MLFEHYSKVQYVDIISLEDALQFYSFNILQLSSDCSDLIGRNTKTSNEPPTVQIFSAALIN